MSARTAFWRPLAEDQERSLEVLLPPDQVRIALSEVDLADLVDVVIDNVFAHTPDGTALRVELRRVGDLARQGGGRKLDRRTRAFWELVLDARSSPPNAPAEALWPGA